VLGLLFLAAIAIGTIDGNKHQAAGQQGAEQQPAAQAAQPGGNP
jgi:hypothetical protein